jgi:hypothetical protein
VTSAQGDRSRSFQPTTILTDLDFGEMSIIGNVAPELRAKGGDSLLKIGDGNGSIGERRLRMPGSRRGLRDLGLFRSRNL